MRTKMPIGSLFPATTTAPASRRRRRRRSPASESPIHETPRAQFRPLACGTILNGNPNRSLPFRWTINPYRGCEFGCSYCFARYTHRFFDEPEPEKSFESRIYVKFQAAQVLAETLTPKITRSGAIAIGTATDPYQPGEKRFQITRRILEVLAKRPGLRLSITTKSPLIIRDLDLLRQIARVSSLTVHVSVPTLNMNLAKILEAQAPSPRRRIETIRALSSAGIAVGAFVMPILPWITDGRADLRGLLLACKQAGACHATGGMVHLLGAAWRAFLPVLRSHFPHLIGAYSELNQTVGRFPTSITAPIMDRFETARTEAELPGPTSDAVAIEGPSSRAGQEMGWLFDV